MSKRYFWIGNAVVVEDVRMTISKLPVNRIEALCIDMKYRNEESRFGMYSGCFSNDIEWVAVDKATFPKEFLTNVLLLT